ncbi:hypothetical protein Tco_0442734 [Tanacetum coccineum]
MSMSFRLRSSHYLSVDSPTAESPGYVAKSDPEEDPEEYEDDETEDGPVDYPVDGGDDGDNDDGDSSGDDADDDDEYEEDEDEEDEEEEEEQLALADFAVVVPIVELVSLPEGTEPVIPPPSTDITTTGARINTLRIASTQALVDAVTAALPSPPLPPLPPSLYIPPPHLDAEERRQGIREVGYGIRDTWVDPAEEMLRDSRLAYHKPESYGLQRVDLLYGGYDDYSRRRVLIVDEEAYSYPYSYWSYVIGLSQVVHYELQTHREQVYAHESQLYAYQTQLKLQGTLIQTQHQIVETLRVMRDMRREMGDMHAELLALREQQKRARKPGPDVRVPDH